MKEHIKLLTDSSIVISRIAQILKEESIPSMVKDNEASSIVSGFGSLSNNVDLFVYKSDLEKAKKVVQAFVDSNNK